MPVRNTVRHLKRISSPGSCDSVLLAALILSIPAFYLILTGPDLFYRNAGHGLYAVAAVLLGADVFARRNKAATPAVRARYYLDVAILLGTLVSAWPTSPPWPAIEWLLRMGYCAIVFIRLSTLVAKYVVPHRLLQICSMAVLMLAVAGAGFYWLEPKVPTYADGVWLAFITGATVGYGDLVPSTPASRIFAAFIVLLGYALFSVVTASIAALLVGEDEKNLRRELHSDMRLLRGEISALRAELRNAFSERSGKDGEEKS